MTIIFKLGICKDYTKAVIIIIKYRFVVRKMYLNFVKYLLIPKAIYLKILINVNKFALYQFVEFRIVILKYFMFFF